MILLTQQGFRRCKILVVVSFLVIFFTAVFSMYWGEVGWLSGYDRKFLQLACFLYKIIIFKALPYLYNCICFQTDINHLNLHHRDLVSISLYNRTQFRKSFLYCISNDNNSLRWLKSMSLLNFKKGLGDRLLCKNKSLLWLGHGLLAEFLCKYWLKCSCMLFAFGL